MELSRCSLAYGDRGDGRCAWCGAWLPSRRRRWCSEQCGRLWTSAHVWAQARAARLAHDGERCTVCGTDEDLQVHHLAPPRKPRSPYSAGCWNHQDRLRTLCALHHLDAHAAIREPAGTVTQLRIVA